MKRCVSSVGAIFYNIISLEQEPHRSSAAGRLLTIAVTVLTSIDGFRWRRREPQFDLMIQFLVPLKGNITLHTKTPECIQFSVSSWQPAVCASLSQLRDP
ncbi:hypothetical protein EVAR_16751_1 [Eumeta japonica]|uniref:Uncharacterized protein n=1 Tax=Eumeta variegata TaxID=151549 RepID=A0A4C1UKT4_EUMVA|nr:hypothetical protein EVAR_16751_1 [Eumeta japonica]